MPEAIQVSLKFFAVARRGATGGSEVLAHSVPAGSTVGQVLAVLGVRHEAEVSLLVRGRVVGWDYALQDGDEVVVIPPLAGG